MDAIPRHFSLQQDTKSFWADASSIQIALHYSSSCYSLAVAKDKSLAVFTAASPSVAAKQHNNQQNQQRFQQKNLIHDDSRFHSSNMAPEVSLQHAMSCPEPITDLAWISIWDTRPSSLSSSLSSSPPPPPQAPPDLTYLLVGTSSGYLQLHDSMGRLMLRQRLHTSPIQRIRVRKMTMGLSPGDPGQEDVCIVFTDSIARISCRDLGKTLLACTQKAEADADATAAKEAKARISASGSQGGPGMSVYGGFLNWGSAKMGLGRSEDLGRSEQLGWTPGGSPGGGSRSSKAHHPQVAQIPFQRWDLPRGPKNNCFDAVCMGSTTKDLYSVLQGGASGRGSREELIFIIGGENPALCSVLAHVQPPSGTLAALQGLASSLTSVTSGAVGMAYAAGTRVASTLPTPGNLTSGLRHILASQLFAPVSTPSTPTSPDLSVSNYDKPTPLLNRVEVASIKTSLRDEGRVVLMLIPSPQGALIAAVDNFGRLLLLDGASMVIVRMWKGYRDAQCGWLQVPEDLVSSRLAQLQDKESGYLLDKVGVLLPCTGGPQRVGGFYSKLQGVPLLAVYSPRRQLLELWQAQGKRLLALARVGAHCKIFEMMRPLPIQPDEQNLWTTQRGVKLGERCLASGLTSCFLFDGERGTITDLEVCLQRAVTKGEGRTS